MKDIPSLLRDFRARTQSIRGLPLPPNDSIGVSLVISDCGEAKIVVELQGVPISLPAHERLIQVASGSVPTHATAYFFSLEEAIAFLESGQSEWEWILSDEESL